MFTTRYFFYAAFIAICFLMPGCYARKNIVVSEYLRSNSEQWPITTKAGKYGIRKVFFGPYSISNILKLDSPSLKESTRKFFSIAYPGRSDHLQERKTYDLAITNGADTAQLLLILWLKTNTTEPGLFTKLVNKKATAKEESWKEAEGLFRFNQGTANYWTFKAGPFTGSLLDG